MMALGGFFLIFEPVPAGSEIPRGPRWVRGEGRCWGGPERWRDRSRRRRRGAGALDALEVFRGARAPSAAPAGSRGPFGQPTVKNGAGTGTAVCDRGPCTPVDAAAPWMWSGALACRRPVHDVDCGA